MSKKVVFDPEVTNNKVATFRKVFFDEFHQAIKDTKDIATGKHEPIIEQGFVDVIWNYLLSRGSASVPFVGQVAGDIANLPVLSRKKCLQDKMVDAARRINNQLIEIEQFIVDKGIEETAYEISRIYEYQISMLDQNNVETLATYGVKKIIEYGMQNLQNLSRLTDLKCNDFISILAKEDMSGKINFGFAHYMHKKLTNSFDSKNVEYK